VYHYTPLPSSLLGSVWVLCDGPLFTLAAQGGALGERAITLASVIEGFLIDGLALWLAILVLASVSSRPSPGQRVASLGIGIGVLGVILSLFWPYVSETLLGDGMRVAWLAGGVIEGVIARYRLMKAEKTVRVEGEGSILYVALLVMLWVAAMSVGTAVSQADASAREPDCFFNAEGGGIGYSAVRFLKKREGDLTICRR